MLAKPKLSAAEASAVLADLNETSPDTYDEGEFGPWTFTKIEQKPKRWIVSFTNRSCDDSVSFESAHHAVANGSRSTAWTEDLNKAIATWEADNLESFGPGD